MSTTESLRSLTDDELTDRYATASDEEVTLILAELERRERVARRHAIDAARWAVVYEDWQTFAHAQYLAAEEECRGNLVRKEYLGEITSGWTLWSGSEKWARERATDELREFWDASARMTVSEFRAQRRAARRDERESMSAE